jgi:hypothetical protein
MADMEKVPAVPEDATAVEEPTELEPADLDEIAGAGFAGVVGREGTAGLTDLPF